MRIHADVHAACAQGDAKIAYRHCVNKRYTRRAWLRLLDLAMRVRDWANVRKLNHLVASYLACRILTSRRA